MNLSKLISPSSVVLNIKARTREEVIRALLSKLVQEGRWFDQAKVLNEVLRREALGSTGVGHGVAIPHARTEAIHEMQVAFGRTQKGIDVEAIEKEPARLFFLVVAPREDEGAYLQTLARISRLMRHEDIRTSLLGCKAEADVPSILQAYE